MSKSLHHSYLMQEKHKKIFEDYSNTFSANLISSWKKHIDKWNKDHSVKPDPYEDIEICEFLNLNKIAVYLIFIRCFTARNQTQVGSRRSSRSIFW